MTDQSLSLCSAVNHAITRRINGDLLALRLRGGGTRVAPLPEALDCSGHTGIMSYQPEELVVRVRAGTRLRKLQSVLLAQGQQLAADIPVPGPASTVGGAIAMGTDGPGRFYGNALRDAVLGCQLINGQGERVTFGGQVMKNVAGYDVPRLQVGARGTLGLLLDVSLKVVPVPEASLSFSEAISPQHLSARWLQLHALRPFLRSALYDGSHLHFVLAGRAQALTAKVSAAGLGAHRSSFNWGDVAAWQLPVFTGESLACMVLPAPLPMDMYQPQWLLDWAATRVWVANGNHRALAQLAASLGGFLQVLRGPAVPNLGPGQVHWHRQIKAAFDPHNIFNPVIFHTHFQAASPLDEGAACRSI
ncbi:FAD-binding protein [Simiduia sp. 21SJ11W-1]|uniref:FAD-binding protein n=1 Tax=Simiduia sp. 21SJ11W-1 TaxID=2909669 RepID=UPI00209C7ABA|nr:FAD-binding protein [Simiduia sp. 21SJ11W-1]UTA48412.1 FAD-binding protein [Simiduia sp. 21SJ11W-1]